MSFEFGNRIQELTSKLTQIKENRPKHDQLEDAKEQLFALQVMCTKELENAERKMKKVEHRLKRRSDRVYTETESVESVWASKQQKVSQIIGEWVSDYEEKVESAMQELQRQQLIFKNKMEEEEQMYEKQAKMMQDKIGNQLKMLQKQLHKWNNLNSQNHSAALKELNAYKQALTRDIHSSQQIKKKQMKNIEQRLLKMKKNSGEKVQQLKDQIDKYTLRINQILKLLLTLD